jgi:hypothetical protein
MCLASESITQTSPHRLGPSEPDFPESSPKLAVLSGKLNLGDLGRLVPPDPSSDVCIQMARSQRSSGEVAFLLLVADWTSSAAESF